MRIAISPAPVDRRYFLHRNTSRCMRLLRLSSAIDLIHSKFLLAKNQRRHAFLKNGLPAIPTPCYKEGWRLNGELAAGAPMRAFAAAVRGAAYFLWLP